MTISRRDFLRTSAALAPLTLAAPMLAESDRPVSSGMKLGLVTLSWGKDWDLPTLIRNCEAAEFSGVELRTTNKHGVEITLTSNERLEVRKRFENSSVELVGPGNACDFHSPDPAVLKKNIEETQAFIKLSHDCGGTGVKVRPNGLPKDVPVEKTIEQIGRSLNQLGQFADDYGQELRLEVHGGGTSALPVIQRIMEIADHPRARVCWNCNPSDLNGDGLEGNFHRVATQISTVHIHDLRKPTYPWEPLFQLLNGISFTGWTLIEEFNIPGDMVAIVAAMRDNRTLWEKLAAGNS